jgi:Sulfotransferase family
MIKQSSRYTLDDNKLPKWAKWLNWSDQQLRNCGISFLKLNKESLIADALKQTHLSDWGDQSFIDSLDVLLNSLNQEANLSLMGRLLLKKYLTDLLVNRLKIQSTFNTHPEILNVPIERPLFITGLPRTGTTFLHRLLAQDPKFRWLHLWELFQPCPPPELAHANTDPRIQATEKLMKKYRALAPLLSTAHLIEIQIPEEGNQLFEHAFSNWLFLFRSHVPTYETWLRSQSMVPQYKYYQQQLQLLSWRWPGRWLLKAPCHLRNLEALIKIFPDACIVQTHRDPSSVVPSLCSLTAIFRNIFVNEIELEVVGKDMLEVTTHSHKKGQQFRSQNPSFPICDVNYNELIEDPIKTVQKIYCFFGDHLQPEAESKMRHWLLANPQTKNGKHCYALEQFGLTEKAVQEGFA